MILFFFLFHKLIFCCIKLCVAETAVDRQIVFPLSHVLHSNGEKNGQPHLHDFSEDIQFMDIEESPGKESR